MDQDGSRYNGILTDGKTWWLFEQSPADGTFTRRSTFDLRPNTTGAALTEWLQAVLATRSNITPTHGSIETLPRCLLPRLRPGRCLPVRPLHPSPHEPHRGPQARPMGTPAAQRPGHRLRRRQRQTVHRPHPARRRGLRHRPRRDGPAARRSHRPPPPACSAAKSSAKPVSTTSSNPDSSTGSSPPTVDTSTSPEPSNASRCSTGQTSTTTC